MVSSASVSTASGAVGVWKLGQPVPESNLVSESNSSWPQPAHRYVAGSWLSQNAPVKARSVPFLRRIWNCSGVRHPRHSASDSGSLSGIPSMVAHSRGARDLPGRVAVRYALLRPSRR